MISMKASNFQWRRKRRELCLAACLKSHISPSPKLLDSFTILRNKLVSSRLQYHSSYTRQQFVNGTKLFVRIYVRGGFSNLGMHSDWEALWMGSEGSWKLMNRVWTGKFSTLLSSSFLLWNFVIFHSFVLHKLFQILKKQLYGLQNNNAETSTGYPITPQIWVGLTLILAVQFLARVCLG